MDQLRPNFGTHVFNEMTNLQLENVNPKRVDENALNKPMIDASGLLKILPQKAQAHFRMIRDKAVAVWRVRLKKNV